MRLIGCSAGGAEYGAAAEEEPGGAAAGGIDHHGHDVKRSRYRMNV